MFIRDILCYLLCFVVVYVGFTILLTRLEDTQLVYNRFVKLHGNSGLQHHLQETTCAAKSSILLAKTHKTAGSSLSCIIARFGYERNLTFALPGEGYIIGYTVFNKNMLLQEPQNGGFDILVNHVRFHKTKMKEVMKRNAKYVTILREPLAHWHSVVKYYSLRRLVSKDEPERKWGEEMDIETLLRKIPPCRYFSCRLGENGQLFDLGVSDDKHFINTTFTRKNIERLDKEFDLVLITEYFDESLILLKKMMCWRFEDILYIPKKMSTDNKAMSFTSKEKQLIRAANAGDVMLYEYFNKTLWVKIKEYGPTFDDDLNHFKRLNERIISTCVDFNSVETAGNSFNYQLRNDSVLCQNLNRDIAPYTLLLAEQVGARPWEKNNPLI